jgi:hypothetical protein
MKIISLTLTTLLVLARSASGQTTATPLEDAKPLPTIDVLIENVIARAVNQEDKNDDLFDMNYQYTRSRVWEYRNGSGELKRREEKSGVRNKPDRIAARNARAIATSKPVPRATPVNNEPVSDAHSNIKGKALKVKDYSIPNLVSRFQFKLIGREVVNGRSSFIVDFKPKSDALPVNSLADKFINRAAGRVWIDEEDSAIAQARLHLTQQVNVFGGLAGAVWKFNYSFTRLRTPEGFWFARNTDWHLEGREVAVNRIVDYHEKKLNEQKIVQTATAQ